MIARSTKFYMILRLNDHPDFHKFSRRLELRKQNSMGTKKRYKCPDLLGTPHAFLTAWRTSHSASETFQKSQSNDRLPLTRDDFPVSHTIRACGHTRSSLLPLAAARIAAFAPFEVTRPPPAYSPRKPRGPSRHFTCSVKRAGHPHLLHI